MPAPELPWTTPRVKSSNEILVYMNMGVGQTVNTLLHDGTVVRSDRDLPSNSANGGYCCGGGCPCPDGSWDATVIQNKNEGAVGPLPVHSFLFAATEDFISPGAEGDIVNHVCLPDPDRDILVCHDQGSSSQPGLVFQDIARKFATVDHRIRARPDNTLTLQNMFVSSWVGLQRFMGTPCTVIIKVNPDGVGALQEVHYYCDVVMTPMPMDSGEGNDPINISMTGTYNFAAIFANINGRQMDNGGVLV